MSPSSPDLDPPRENPSPSFPPSRVLKPFSRKASIFWALVIAAILLWTNFSWTSQHPLDQVEYPVETALWMATKDMQVLVASKEFPLLKDWVAPDIEEVDHYLLETMEWARKQFPEGSLQLQFFRTVLAYEYRGKVQGGKELSLLRTLPKSPEIAEALSTAYEKREAPLESLSPQLMETIGDHWARSQLEVRWARMQHDQSQEYIADWQLDEGRQVVSKLVWTGVIYGGFLLVGLVSLVLYFFRRQEVPAGIPQLPIFEADAGPLFLRGFGYGNLFSIAVVLAPYFTDLFYAFFSFVTLIPFLILGSFRYRAHFLNFLKQLIPVYPQQIPAFLGLAVAVASLDFLLMISLSALEPLLGSPHWTESINFDLIFSEWPYPWFHFLNGVVGAPLSEEILFRGLLFTALRRRFSFAMAATVSSLVFTGFHPYGWLGLLSVFWFGFMQAWLYEKSRSLFPCLLSHFFVNYFVFGSQMLVYG